MLLNNFDHHIKKLIYQMVSSNRYTIQSTGEQVRETMASRAVGRSTREQEAKQHHSSDEGNSSREAQLDSAQQGADPVVGNC